MRVIDYIDGAARRIYLHPDTVGKEVHPMDIYKEVRTLRKTDESLRKYNMFLRGFGKVPKGGGKFTERYVRCEEGTRIVPYDVTHQITITGTIITDDGQEGVACFDKSSLTITTSVDISYIPPQVEVITVNTGSGLDTLQQNTLTSIYLALLGDRAQDILSGEIVVYEEDGVTPRHTLQAYKDDTESSLADADTIRNVP